MNIKQNIVRIKTASQMGTGIIYPCELDEGQFDKTKYIIFTNRHLLEEIYYEENIKLLLDLDIYDNEGKMINIHDEDVSLQIFVPPISADTLPEDIAALLLIFSYKLNLRLETKIMYDDFYLDKIFIEGFPQILHDNNISSKIQIRGRYKDIYPSNEKIGVFQIVDDYHWYSNYKDLRLFQGFSGSPIYCKEENYNYILGMNQSMLNIGDGENPFKLLYYYKIKFVLEYLREQGCIIFNKNSDNSVSIKWIYDKKESKDSTEKNLLLLGASGAGKSSFAKTFLLHSDRIDSTNDGQTTRSNIIYELSLFNKNPKVEIRFLDKTRFKSRMYQLNYENYILQIINLIEENIIVTSIKEYIQYLCIKNESLNFKESEIKNMVFKNYNDLFLEDYQNSIEEIYNFTENHILSVIKLKYDNFDKFIKENEKELNTILFKVEGFFNINEFNFYNMNINEKEIIEKIKSNNKSLEEYFYEFYDIIFAHIIGNLKNVGLIKENNYLFRIDFAKDNDLQKWLPFCFQVKNKKSLTGIIDYVHIYDSISNEYAFILNDLNIKKLKIIDTYGLDHANWEQEKSYVLSDILYSLQEKKLVYFNSDLAVVYIKKLDSGKPTELKSIIPLIYNMIPQAPIYCVFNGLDIFLKDKIKYFKSLDYFNTTDTVPKSIEYLISEEGKKDILCSISSKNSFKENLYDTLKNNIATFCGDEGKTRKYYNIYDNNRKEIYKLLLSISMKEYSSMNIIPQKFIDKLKTDEYDEQINKIIKQIFDNSSKTDWGITHWRTRNANYTRIQNKGTLGYWGTYEHRWNQLFHKGFINTIIQYQENLMDIEENVNYISAIDSCIKNMEEIFLGHAYQLINIELKNDEPIEKFRALIEKMYKNGIEQKIYTYNPFNKKKSSDSSDKIQYLNDVYNFSKGYELIKVELIKHFKECLILTINEDNKSKSSNLIKINYNFYSQLKKLEFEFNKRYDNVTFGELLKYYAEINNQ